MRIAVRITGFTQSQGIFIFKGTVPQLSRITSLFAIYNLQFTFYNLQFTIYYLQFTIYNLQFTIYKPLFRKKKLTFFYKIEKKTTIAFSM